MELDAFIRQVVRRWYIIVVLVAAAIGGTLVYHLVTGEQKATSVMAVLQPKVAAPGEYIPPVITLEAVDESSELAERVERRRQAAGPPGFSATSLSRARDYVTSAVSGRR